MDKNNKIRTQCEAAAKSLRWIVFQFSGADGNDETDKTCRVISAYCKNGADLLDKTVGIAAEVERYKQWVNDLQSGMYVNCVYCGHRYGPAKDTPVSMAEVLKAHIEQCPEHPMSKLKKDLDAMTARAEKAEKEREAAVEFAIRVEQDYMECDKMFIHVEDFKQKVGYNAYVVDAKSSGAKHLSFGKWLRGQQKEKKER